MMGRRDTRLWAQEEMADAVKRRLTELLQRPDLDADDEHELKKQCARVLKFLRQI